MQDTACQWLEDCTSTARKYPTCFSVFDNPRYIGSSTTWHRTGQRNSEVVFDIGKDSLRYSYTDMGSFRFNRSVTRLRLLFVVGFGAYFYLIVNSVIFCLPLRSKQKFHSCAACSSWNMNSNECFPLKICIKNWVRGVMKWRTQNMKGRKKMTCRGDFQKRRHPFIILSW